MNKYQEALDKVKSVPLFIEPKEDRNGWKIYLEVSSIEEKNKTDIDVLQELVDKVPYYKELEDKETPKKPEWGRTELGCGNCESTRIKDRYNGEKNKFCPVCGQAIDWSNDD